MRLASRILLVILASLVPVVGVQIYNTNELFKSRDVELRNAALRQAELAASEINRMIEGMHGIMITVGQAPVVRAFTTELCSPFLERLTQHVKYMQQVVVVDNTGAVRCGSMPSQFKFNVADREYFKQAVTQNELVIGEVIVSHTTQELMLPLALPLMDDAGQQIGVIASAMDGRWLSDELLARGIPDGGSVTIADKAGTVFARQPDPEKFAGTKIPDKYMYLLTAPEQGVVEVESQDGTRRLLGYVPVSKPPYGLYISAGLSVKQSYADLKWATWRQLAITALAVLGTFWFAYLISRKFVTDPLQALIATVNRWQDNDLSARTGLTPAQGEPGMLGYQFDRTIENISRREEAINVLLRELVHRSKNQITLLISLCTRLAQGQKTVPGYRDAIIERLLSLSTSLELLLRHDGKAVGLETLVHEHMKHFEAGAPARISIAGPAVMLNPEMARSLGMAIHELATNATKYGALSSPKGRVSIKWEAMKEQPNRIALSWTETGGPPVHSPDKHGFGSTLIEKIVPMQLNGSGKLHYLPEGVVWSLQFEGKVEQNLSFSP